MQALALEPELRFSSAEEFSRALLQYQQTKSLEKTRKEKQRRKWISLLSVFLVLAIVGGTVGYLWISRTAQETLPDAAIDVWFTADPLRRKRAEQDRRTERRSKRVPDAVPER